MRAEGMSGLVRGRKTLTTIPGKNGRRAGELLNDSVCIRSRYVACESTGAPVIGRSLLRGTRQHPGHESALGDEEQNQHRQDGDDDRERQLRARDVEAFAGDRIERRG